MKKIMNVAEGNKNNFVKGYLRNYNHIKDNILVLNYSKEKGDEEIWELCVYNEIDKDIYDYKLVEKVLSGAIYPRIFSLLIGTHYPNMKKIIIIFDCDKKYKDRLNFLLDEIYFDCLIVI